MRMWRVWGLGAQCTPSAGCGPRACQLTTLEFLYCSEYSFVRETVAAGTRGYSESYGGIC